VEDHAAAANIGGKSNVDRDRTKQYEYQLAGQMSEAALFVWAGHNSEASFWHYDQRRQKVNLTPRKGTPGWQMVYKTHKLNVKGSHIRNPSRKLLDYHLYVRRAEMKADRFVLALVPQDASRTIKLVGWFPRIDLREGVHNLVMRDRFEIRATALYPMHLFEHFDQRER
jgi:hypothetical protein